MDSYTDDDMDYEKESIEKLLAKQHPAYEMAAVWVLFCITYGFSLKVSKLNQSVCVILTEFTEGTVLWTSKDRDEENPRAHKMPQAN